MYRLTFQYSFVSNLAAVPEAPEPVELSIAFSPSEKVSCKELAEVFALVPDDICFMWYIVHTLMYGFMMSFSARSDAFRTTKGCFMHLNDNAAMKKEHRI